MSAPLRDDDSAARADLEADCVRAEREYAIARHERLNDFAPACLPPWTAPDGDDDPGLDISSSGDSRVPAKRARVTSLLNRIFASRSTSPTDADGGAGGRRSRANAGPTTTSTKGSTT